MTKEILAAEYAAIKAVAQGLQVCAIYYDGNFWTSCKVGMSMPTLDDEKKYIHTKSHTFGKLLKVAKENEATHIVAFTDVPYEEPIILLELKG